MDGARRRVLKEQFEQAVPQVGLYRIRNLRTGRLLLGSTTNLAGVRNRFEFALATGSGAALDHRLRSDIASFGLDALVFDVLDILDVRPTMSREEVAADLATLEALWREKTDPALLY